MVENIAPLGGRLLTAGWKPQDGGARGISTPLQPCKGSVLAGYTTRPKSGGPIRCRPGACGLRDRRATVITMSPKWRPWQAYAPARVWVATRCLTPWLHGQTRDSFRALARSRNGLGTGKWWIRRDLHPRWRCYPRGLKRPDQSLLVGTDPKNGAAGGIRTREFLVGNEMQ